MTDMPQTAYKVLTADQMATLEQDGTFAGAPVDVADGYIHLSTAAQLTETVDRHFPDQTDLHIAAVDLGSFGGSLKWEESRGGQLFPTSTVRCCWKPSSPTARWTATTTAR